MVLEEGLSMIAGFSGKTPLIAYRDIGFPFLSAIRARPLPPLFNLVRGSSMEYLLRDS